MQSYHFVLLFFLRSLSLGLVSLYTCVYAWLDHLICVATLPCKTQKFEISAQHSVYDRILYTNSNDSAR